MLESDDLSVGTGNHSTPVSSPKADNKSRSKSPLLFLCKFVNSLRSPSKQMSIRRERSDSTHNNSVNEITLCNEVIDTPMSSLSDGLGTWFQITSNQ